MRCLAERKWIIGALFFVPGGSAFADGAIGESREVEIVANIASPQVEVLPAIPSPQQYMHQYQMEYLSNSEKQLYAQMDNYYIAPIPKEHRYERASASPYPDSAPQQLVTRYLDVVESAKPLIQIVQVPDYGLTNVLHYQRRLALTIDQWVFSATARVSLDHSHNMGANLFVRHGF
ncbi:hypothetical protein [Pararobbsia alpina]|uniref:Uncharacterized protein n=1 Tax=Pararobbsia alpina TaxID=621374 RepID=A0A6S7BQJ0_9BURK|nr:hypothetical protein [Pararobbsia alpina]CAB3807981.1 hypothetical protein LMG28138_05992 [Pararobbsia alpina]